MTMQGGTARDRLRARAQAMYGGKRREDEEQQNRQNQRQEAETPAVGSARDRLRQRASAMGEVTGQVANAQEPTQERSRLTVEGYEAAIKGMQERMGGQTGLTKSDIVRHTQSRETEKWRQEQAKKYSGLRDQADYAKKSTKVDQSLASGKGAYIFGHYVGKGDDVYSYINSIGTAYENRSNAGKTPSGKLAKYAYMTDDEVADYNYLYQTKGKEEAEKYLEYMGTELDARRAAGFSKWNSELAEKAPVLASAASVPMNLASGVGLVGVGLQNIRNQVTGEYKPINYYSPAMDATVASTAIRGTRAQQLTDKYGTIQMDEKEHPLLSRIFNGKSWGDVYQLGMSMVDSAAAAGIGKGTGLTAAGTALLGGSAGSQGVLDAVERGATDSQALTMGILNATFESLFEYVSLDHLLKGNTKNILKGFLKQGFIEGSEEWNTTLFNTIADVLVMAENSGYKTSVRDYMEQGYSEKEAERQAMFDIAVGMGWDFVGGAISGGLMDTGKQIVRDATYKSKFGKASGDIVAEAQEVAPGTALTQKAQERIDAGKSLTGHQIVNLLQQNEDAIRTGDMVTIRNAVAERLAQYGESQNIDRVADAITKQVAGEKLSGKEKALVENSAYGQRVLNEMNPENISEGGFNSDWAGQLGTTQINAEAYSQKLREAQAETQQEEPQQTERQEMTPEEMAVLSAWNSEAESSPANSTTVQPNLGDRETLEKLGVKTGSQLRAEVRQALTERQDVAQKVQQRTQVAQQTQETQGTTQQTQGEPVTLEEASKAYGKQAKAFLRTYQQGQDVEKFSEAYRIAHEMGQSNVPYRVVQGLRSLDYLTEAQKDIAYRTGASAEKQERGGKKATWRRQGVVRAENGAKLSDLSKTFNVPQKQGYRILSDIAKSTGVDIVLYRSKGDAEGNITEAEGRFRRSENTIYIDVNSGIANVSSTADFSQYTMLRTFNHEFTHFIEQNADEEYRQLRKLVFEVMQEKLDGQGVGVTVDDLIREKQDKYRQALGQDISYDEAGREVVADAMTDILPDSHFMETLYNRNATLAEKLIGKLKDFIAKVKAYFDGLTTNTKAEAALLKEMRDGGLHYLESIVEAYDKAATAAVENYQGADKVLQENGIDVSEDGKSASMDAFSVRTMLNEKQQKSVEKALAERFDVTEEEAGGWLKAETSLASIILNPKYSMYLDYEADAAEEAIKKNLDYPQGTVDFSTICKKRRDFTDVMNRIFRVYPNHVFQAEDLAKIRTIMQQEGMNVACGICYVEDRRQLDSIVAEDFLQGLELYRNGSETRPDGKPFNQNQLRGLRYTNGDTYVPTVAELITLEGNNALKKKNPNMAEAWRRYNNARGMQSVRRLTNEAEYKRQILKYSKRTVQSKNSKGGLRIFSFSDMEMFHLLDVMQIITDASTKGLYIQGYTKVNEYAKAVKDTGLKLNRSLIPAGDLGYHMEGGKPVLDFDTTEGIDIHAKDFFDSSGNPNIGNIVIGINDTQIRAAMVSEFIDQIIPFHTGQSKAVLREKRIDAWENYKDYQTDKDMETGKTAKQQVNIYTDVLQVLEREGAEITKRSFVEKYLEVCRERGLIPRFAQFLNQDAEGNYVYTEGYHKLLVDFKTFAQTEKGEYLPQKDVRPVFDEQYLTGILKDYAKEQSRRDSAMKKQMPQVIQRISDEVVQEGDVQFSLRDPVEETRDLLALHNMTADNLRGALKLGGLPMPSIAIVKAAAGHSKYGPISVVFEKSTIDPQADRRNKVYGGDAYTPTAPKVEYPVNDRAMRKVEKHLAELSGQVAGGIFLNDTALRRLGIEDESSMNADALAERLARDDSVQAAYLADSGKALEPVRQPKEFSKFGNGALQQLVSEVGVQELARINAEMQTGNYAAVREIEGTIRDIIRSTYEVQHRGFLDRKPELKQKRIAHYMENNVNIRTVEDFARDAWNFYQDNGATTDEIDRWATADKLHEMVTQDQVKAWLRPQLEGLLGEAGIYNGKERYTSSGNQRSFAQTHYAYTLENIVRAMAETQKERGGQTFGVTAKTMQAVSTPSYDSIAAIKADSGRLGAVEGEAYDAAVQKVETQIEQAIRKVMRENKPHSDNQFDEMEIIGEVMMEAAKGTKTEAAIQRAFQKEDYTISKETAKVVQKLFRDAAALPTEYFEAKPQRAVPFNEAAAVVVPDDLPVGLKKGLEELGATVREYKAGDEQSRLEAVNAIPDVQFSIREIKGEDGTNYGKGVYLDSTLLEGLTDAERKEMMRERVKELGGQTITAYDPNGEAVDIRIAAPSEKFRNRNGRRVPVTNDLARKNRDVKVKQESVVLADELIATSQYKRPRKAKYPHGWLDNNGKNDWQYWTTYIQDKNNTVWEATLNVAESANGVKYLYDIDPIEKVGQPVKSGTSTTLVGQPVKSGTSTTGDIVAQDQTESQAQIRSSTLSDRDVLRIAAQMAKNSESRSLTDADRARLGIIEQKLGRIDEAEEQRQGFLEEKRAILAGREAKELSDAERAQLRKVQKNLDAVNGKIRRLNEELSQTQEKKVVKALLKKARVVVERDAVQRSVSSYRETRQRAEYMGKLRRSVERNVKRLQEMLLTNTDKKHVPEALKKPVAELLRSMNLISKRGLAGGAMTKADERYVKALRGIQDVLARQSLYEESGKGDDLIGGYLDLPAGFQMLLNAYVSKVEKAIEEHPLRNGVLQTMTVEELEETNTVLSVISTAVTEMNKLMVNRQFATVVDAAEDTIWALNEHEQHQRKTGENFLVWDNCLPWYAFQRFGEGGKSIFQGLMNGWDKLSFNTKKVLDFRNGLIDDKTARKWDTETHTVMLESSKGGQDEVTLTTAQLMSLYCLSRRKQAMGHLMGGGIRIASIDIAEEIESARAAEEGKPVREKKKKKKDVDQAEHYLLTQGELGRLLSLLTPEQVQAAKAMQRYMTEQGSAWGNEVSMRRFGYRAFTEENYFPIETDSQDRPAKTDSKEGSLYRLLNISAVKPLTEGANNAIMVRSIFDVFANHMADMAKYNALALPVLDAQKWYNYKDSSKNKDNGQVRTRTVQREMTRAWGSGANNYVVTFLKDINGVKENGARGEGMAAKAISKYKRAAVAANLRVAMLQPTSYVRASAVIDHKYLAKAITKKVITKAEGQEMLQYSGVALWKEMGFFDTDVGRSIRDRIKGKGSKIEDLVDKSMAAAQAGDKITWERLWLACKLEAEEKRHLTGEELMEATAERFREVIYRTQVVDSTMTRSHMMRDGGTFSKIATSFMSEATVSYNMLMNSTLDTLQDAQSMGMQKAVKKNWRQLGRAYQAYILAGAASAIAGALADALRDWDDDSFLEKFWKAFWGEKPEKVKDQVLNIMLGLEGNLAGELNPLSKIPLIRDVTNTFGGFSTDRMDMAAWANLYSLLGIWEETIGLWTGSLDKATKTTYYGNMTTYNKIYKTAQVVSQFTGLPISATMREIVTMWNSTVGLAYPGTKVRTYESRKVREAYEQYGKSVGLSYVMILRAAEAVRQLESDKDEDGNAISGSLKKKYVEYIQSLHLSAKQEKAMWNCIKKTSWSDKDTPWGK